MATEGLVIVRGGGDLGTGVAHRLFRAGYAVVVLEREDPRVVRRTVSFAQAAFDGAASVEGVETRKATVAEAAAAVSGPGRPDWVPLVIDPEGASIEALRPGAVVDARMAKRNLGTVRGDAPVTIGLGPGFRAGEDVDYVVETMRGHSLGRLIDEGSAAPDTGVPAEVRGVGRERVIRSPGVGQFRSVRAIGDLVGDGELVGTVGEAEARAGVSGLLRGLVADGTRLRGGDKLGDVDPRGSEIDHMLISDKARAVAGAVLEGLLRGRALPRCPTTVRNSDV
ncbi:MAG: EF2563 family selenium-dependent molybdenum hydroxylase system protein [Candidatus Eisenbacteria bacterium]|nr:EF2563 family selenium-dependent molybdenum hydroxylase system protein [Candidatus Eisenbacteria bacterium]